MNASTEFLHPEIVVSRPPPFSRIGFVVDVVLTLLAFYAVARLWGAELRGDVFVALLLATVLSFPGTVGYRSISALVVRQLLARSALVMAALAVFALASGAADQRMFILSAGLAACMAIAVAHVLAPGMADLASRLRKPRRVVIVGANRVALRIRDAIVAGDGHHEELVGYFDDRSPDRYLWGEPGNRLGGLAEVGAFLREQPVSRVYITLPVTSAQRVQKLLRDMQDSTASTYVVPDIDAADIIQCRLSVVGGVPVVSVCETPLHGVNAAVKRVVDVGVTLALMPLLLPIMALIVPAIRLTSEGPALFRQRRYGLDGEEILVWKFRTMRMVEDGHGTYRQVTRDDDRITPVGRLLRRTSLDELPQFFNVLAGTMSIVGPRPHALAVNERYRKLIPRYMLRHKVKPGITGWAQVNGHRGGDDLDALSKRTACDIEYLKSWSLSLDFLIILRTASLLVRGDKHAF